MPFLLENPIGAVMDQPPTPLTSCPDCGRAIRSVRAHGNRFVSCTGFPRCNWNMGADALTVARMRAHDVFDQVWKGGIMSRNSAYDMMARLLQIPRDRAHISKLTISQCRELIEKLRGIVEVD